VRCEEGNAFSGIQSLRFPGPTLGSNYNTIYYSFTVAFYSSENPVAYRPSKLL